MSDIGPVCPNKPAGAVCDYFTVGAPLGTVIDQIVSAKITDRVINVNKIDYTNPNGTSTSIPQNAGAAGGTSTSVAACAGGYAGFNYWADTTTDTNEDMTVRGVEFLCRDLKTGNVFAEPVMGQTGGSGSTQKKTGILCPPGQSLVAFTGTYISGLTGTIGPFFSTSTGGTGGTGPTGTTSVTGWWWGIDPDLAVCGTLSSSGTTGSGGTGVPPKGLTTWEIVLIVGGVILALIIIILLFVIFSKRKETSPEHQASNYIPQNGSTPYG